MKNKFSSLLIATVMAFSTFSAPAQAADLGGYNCAEDTFYFRVPNWDNAQEASDELASSIRLRLSIMMISPGWENVHTVVVSGSSRPFVLREYGVDPYNARVTYQYCWEYKDNK